MHTIALSLALSPSAYHHTTVNGIVSFSQLPLLLLLCAFQFLFTPLVNIVYVRPGFIHTKTQKHTDNLHRNTTSPAVVCL